MRKLIIICIVLLSACNKSAETTVNELTMTELKKTFQPVQLDGVQITVYKDTPKNIYSKIVAYEEKRWKWRAENALKVSGTPEADKLNVEADSIHNMINNYFDKAKKTQETDVYYYSKAIVIKEDTTINKTYYFDNNFNLIANTGNK